MSQNKKRRISQKGCRQKGHQFERDMANALKKIFPNARRQLEYHVEDAKGVDIAYTDEFKFQCKRNRKYCNPSKIEEIQLDPIEGGVPILITKGDDKPPLVCLELRHFLPMLKAYRKIKS